MTDRPIAFSPPMVRALLAGRKTQTRRVLDMPSLAFDAVFNDDGVWCVGDAVTGHQYAKLAVRHRVGDRLYVREAWRSAAPLDDTAPRDMSELLVPPIRYEADGETVNWKEWRGHDAGRLRQGMHMPRWASRLTLIVTEVRVQRLQEISEADAITEGMNRAGDGRWFVADPGAIGDLRSAFARDAYAALWDSLNDNPKRPGVAWRDNPWVAAYSFTVHRGNIDQIGGAA